MIPLMVCSVLVLAIVIEKFIGMGAMERKANKFIEKAQGILKSNEERKIDKVFALCEMSSSPPARILQAGIRKISQGREEIKEAVIDAGSLEVPYLGRYLRILSTVVTISPLLGLLGTVVEGGLEGVDVSLAVGFLTAVLFVLFRLVLGL